MPKIIDHDQRREEIAQQINSLISEKGIENTTIRAICRRSGFSTGVLAHYFENREAMLIYVFEWHMLRVYRRLESLENVETTKKSVLLKFVHPAEELFFSSQSKYFVPRVKLLCNV